MPHIIHSISELRDKISQHKQQNQLIGFVPTMGALHNGHMSLVHKAKAACDVVVVSIFVNPMQFSANEDLDSYPNMIERDTARLKEIGVDIIYIPTPELMYPPHFSTSVNVSGVSSGLCGDVRPHHFQGVATVVNKLFNQVQPDKAYFGEKDYQQLCVIKRMVKDLDMPIDIEAVPTMREADGLAMSSRNQHLNEQERQLAPMLHRVLQDTADALRAGKNIRSSIENASNKLTGAGFNAVDYVELRHPDTLEPLSQLVKRARLLSAVRIHATRLIDNIEI